MVLKGNQRQASSVVRIGSTIRSASRLLQQVPQPAPPNPEILFVPGPVDDEGLALDGHEIDEPPEAAVIGKIPIVAHDKELAFGNGDRPQIVPGLLPARYDFGILVDAVAVLDGLSIYVQFLVAQFDDIAALRADYPNFFWKSVHPYIGDALRYLKLTHEGQRWLANLYAQVFATEHDQPF